MKRADADRVLPSADVLSATRASTKASVLSRWKQRRNLVIYVAHKSGLSQRLLADVFDIPRSSVAAAIKQYEATERMTG